MSPMEAEPLTPAPGRSGNVPPVEMQRLAGDVQGGAVCPVSRAAAGPEAGKTTAIIFSQRKTKEALLG